ncbi:MAG: phage tail protein [Xanthomonadales bacterium]|nr:phage tail protein [Xanthomonadales bacterium]
MSDPFVAEIRMFAGNFAPHGWAYCDGQVLPLSQNTALFSLLGTTYGGDGKSNFALPDLRGRSPMQHGQGPGLSDRFLGETGGSAEVSLNEGQMPAHAHAWRTAADPADLQAPGPNRSMTRSSVNAYAPGPASTNLAAEMLNPQGGNLPHNNRQPYLGLTFIIALQGVYPPRP